jgi:hypothetical protein
MLLASAAFCLGSECSRPDGDGATPLHETDADIDIVMFGDTGDAAVSARFVRGFSTVRLSDEQDVAVNGESLERNASTGRYDATIPAADVYVVRVQEPTRGIDESSFSSPNDFDITSPADGGDASLSGFVLEWTVEDGALVEVLLTQELLDDTKRLEVDPTPDTGMHAFDAQALADAGFGQGAPMTIAITKIVSSDGIDGFDEGEMTIRWTKVIEVAPAP